MAVKDTATGKQQEALARRATTALPPLESGDRLTRREFERRYDAMPNIRKAELIEGVVYMPTPVHYAGHSRPHGYIMAWLGAYCAATPGVDLGDNATVRLDIDNEVQPDTLLRIEPAAGGRSHVSEDDYVEGPPELIVEIAGSSASIDLHYKLRVYRRNGVQEYIVWQVYDQRVDWFHLSEGEYTPLMPDESGVVRSKVFPGLHLAIPSLLGGDLARVLAVLQQGLATAEHAEFVARLAQKT
ncbi:MAG TPA: Uma2 family endonuclease [Anaerolineae bacterium]|nr:Uma2 family endonuclease [Anaerolineae bacterium]